MPSGDYNGTWSKEAREKRYQSKFVTKKCANCDAPITGHFQYYCSTKCGDDFFFANHGGIWSEFRKKVLQRDNNKCARCGKEGNQVDHILELDRGGTNRLDNLQTLCDSCHKIKTTSYIKKKHRKPYNDLFLVNPDDFTQPSEQQLISVFLSAEKGKSEN